MSALHIISSKQIVRDVFDSSRATLGRLCGLPAKVQRRPEVASQFPTENLLLARSQWSYLGLPTTGIHERVNQITLSRLNGMHPLDFN